MPVVKQIHHLACEFPRLADQFKNCQDKQKRKELLLAMRILVDEADHVIDHEAVVLPQDRIIIGADVYDIFAGTSEKDAVWCEAVVGRERARDRMQEIAAAEPGAYFLFHTANSAIIDKINTVRRAPAS